MIGIDPNDYDPVAIHVVESDDRAKADLVVVMISTSDGSRAPMFGATQTAAALTGTVSIGVIS